MFAALLGVVALLVQMRGAVGFVQAQESKRFQYKIIDVLPDTQQMQIILNQYGADGWELAAVSMGDLTVPRFIFKK
jgi:hypothetical protein